MTRQECFLVLAVVVQLVALATQYMPLMAAMCVLALCWLLWLLGSLLWGYRERLLPYVAPFTLTVLMQFAFATEAGVGGLLTVMFFLTSLVQVFRALENETFKEVVDVLWKIVLLIGGNAFVGFLVTANAFQ